MWGFCCEESIEWPQPLEEFLPSSSGYFFQSGSRLKYGTLFTGPPKRDRNLGNSPSCRAFFPKVTTEAAPLLLTQPRLALQLRAAQGSSIEARTS